MNNGIVTPDRFTKFDKYEQLNSNSKQTYSIDGFSSIVDPTNVEQIIIHSNRTSISSCDAEWAAYSPWIGARVKNLHGRYPVAPIIPSHSISAMRQICKFYVAAVRSHHIKYRRDCIQSRDRVLQGFPQDSYRVGSSSHAHTWKQGPETFPWVIPFCWSVYCNNFVQ